MLVRVVGEICATGNSKTQKCTSLCRSGLKGYVSLKNLELVKLYSNMEDGVDCDIGGTLFDELMFESGFCKKPDEHTTCWYEGKKVNDPNVCNCDYLFDTDIYVIQLTNGKQYVVHPEENQLFQGYVSRKKLKNEN